MTEFLRSGWPFLLALLQFVLALWVTLHAVLRKPETSSVIGWVGLAWLTPFIGVIAYFCLGINRIERRAVSLEIGAGVTLEAPSFEAEDLRLRDAFLERHPNLAGLAQLGGRVTGKPLLPGNAVTLLRDGDEAFPAMLEAIAEARTSVALLSYIFDSDRIGDQFLEALRAAKERGVEVRVLVDHVGSRYSNPNMISLLAQEGIEVAAFLKTRKPALFKYFNLRNHRKILVVDGCLGFTGGTNIREGHALGLKPPFPVQCAHFRIEGPVVGHLQEVFAVDWAFSSGEVLKGEAWFPALGRTASRVGARGIADGPDEDLDNMSEVILGAVATASRSIRIVSPYFLPDEPILRSLAVAALRGVEVDIVLPSANNVPLVDWAGVSLVAQLIEKGCRVYRSAPPFDHSKLMVIDGAWSLIGSTNWDPRSLRLNFEFNVECYSLVLAGELEELIAEKKSGGRLVALEEIQGRSIFVKLRDGLARLASPYL